MKQEQFLHVVSRDEAERIFQVILENYEGTEVADAAADLIPAAQ